jgi:hypothetical protein
MKLRVRMLPWQCIMFYVRWSWRSVAPPKCQFMHTGLNSQPKEACALTFSFWLANDQIRVTKPGEDASAPLQLSPNASAPFGCAWTDFFILSFRPRTEVPKEVQLKPPHPRHRRYAASLPLDPLDGHQRPLVETEYRIVVVASPVYLILRHSHHVSCISIDQSSANDLWSPSVKNGKVPKLVRKMKFHTSKINNIRGCL